MKLRKIPCLLCAILLAGALGACGIEPADTGSQVNGQNDVDLSSADNETSDQDQMPEEYYYSINEILQQDPMDQFRLLIQNSIVPEESASASEKLSNRICENIKVSEISRNDSGIRVRITYPNVADAFLEVYNAAGDDTLVKDIYAEVERRIQNGECELVTREYDVPYAQDGVALDFGEEIADALSGGLYSMEWR